MSGDKKDDGTSPDESDKEALSKLQKTFDWAYGHAIQGIPGVPGAEALADRFLGLHPDRETAINALIKWHTIYAGTAGFLTSFGGVITLPVAVPVKSGRCALHPA